MSDQFCLPLPRKQHLFWGAFQRTGTKQVFCCICLSPSAMDLEVHLQLRNLRLKEEWGPH